MSSDAMRILFDGRPYAGEAGQSLAAVLMAGGVRSWRRTSASGRPRGVFCGIGVCFDCLAVVNGVRDVRLCRRRAVDGDVVATQDDNAPDPAPGGST